MMSRLEYKFFERTASSERLLDLALPNTQVCVRRIVVYTKF